LLSEKLSLAGIRRTAQVSESWLQRYVKEKRRQALPDVEPQDVPPQNSE
jgi:hypothetical protein